MAACSSGTDLCIQHVMIGSFINHNACECTAAVELLGFDPFTITIYIHMRKLK